jgi:hypothetical protein
VRTEEIGQSGLNDGRSVAAAEVWIADDRIGEVSSSESDANAFATVNFPPAMFDEIADIDTGRNPTSCRHTNYRAARVASTIEPVFATRVVGRDRDSFRAALGGPQRRSSGNSEDSVQRATQKSWAVFVPGCSHTPSRHRFS